MFTGHLSTYPPTVMARGAMARTGKAAAMVDRAKNLVAHRNCGSVATLAKVLLP